MIKVIAADMDGTLLNDEHALDQETYDAIKQAIDRGMRFIIATGRNLNSVEETLQGFDLPCDYVLASGAEIRDRKHRVLRRVGMPWETVERVLACLDSYHVVPNILSDEHHHCIGTREAVEASLVQDMKLFHMTASDEKIINSELYQNMLKNLVLLPDVQALKALQIPVYKISLNSGDAGFLEEIRRELERIDDLAVASSFPFNIEITDVRAQKGPALKYFIEKQGYHMDEVMVLGDSMNDYSMFTMPFGATVAMGNSMPEILKVAKYITRTNTEHGVAHAIRSVLQEPILRTLRKA
ncbi:MAG: Cof-type HAD-IIB family hydrolase [Lachnospiraceae bacterium]|nr:Cof-type HAD-IIB family hydrolase [Lachnospiraceae bacterium]